MSFDEIGMTVNSDFGVPLNHLIWLQDYKMYGEDSYVFQHKDIWIELLRNHLFVNDIYAYKEVLEQANTDAVLGKSLDSIYALGFSEYKDLITDANSLLLNFGAFDKINTCENFNDWRDRLYDVECIKQAITSIKELYSATIANVTNTTLTLGGNGNPIILESIKVEQTSSTGGSNGNATITANVYGHKYSASKNPGYGTITVNIDRIITSPIDIIGSSAYSGFLKVYCTYRTIE